MSDWRECDTNAAGKQATAWGEYGAGVARVAGERDDGCKTSDDTARQSVAALPGVANATKRLGGFKLMSNERDTRADVLAQYAEAYESGFTYADALHRSHGALYAVREHLCMPREWPTDGVNYAYAVGENDALLLVVSA